MVLCRVSALFCFSSSQIPNDSFCKSPVLPPPPPTSTHTIHAALMRSGQPSLGTIVLSALIVTAIRAMGIIAMALRALPAYLPPYMRIVSVGATMAVGYLEAATSSLSTYALIYTGLTGDAFFPSARRARALTGAVENPSLVNYRRRFKTERECSQSLIAPAIVDASCHSSAHSVDCGTSHVDIPLCADHLPVCRSYVERARLSVVSVFACWPGHCARRFVLHWPRQGYVGSHLVFSWNARS